jgi:hypothetical protein
LLGEPKRSLARIDDTKSFSLIIPTILYSNIHIEGTGRGVRRTYAEEDNTVPEDMLYTQTILKQEED